MSTGRLPPDSRAILIGVSEYQDAAAFPGYPAVANSVRGMHEILTDPALGGWRQDQVTLILNPGGSGKLLGELRTMARATTGVLLFYFVGHGVLSPGNELCLTISDTDSANPDITGLEYSKIKKMLYDGTPAATRIAILDACYSGRAIGLGAADQQSQFADLTAAHGAYTLTAADDIASVDTAATGAASTAMTGELVRLVRTGIPGGPRDITLAQLYPRLRQALLSKELPQPNQRGDDLAGQFVFTRNAHDDTAPAAPPLPAPPTRVAVPVDGPQWIGRLDGHTERVTALAFSPDGRLLATGGDDWTVRIWDPVAGRELHTLTGFSSPVNAVAFSPDGRALATGDGGARIWDPVSGRLLYNVPERATPVDAVVFGPDGQSLVTATVGRAGVRFWNLASKRKPRTVGDDEVRAIALSPDGKWLAVAGGFFDEVHIRNPATGRKSQLVGKKLEVTGVHALAFSPDGRWLGIVKRMGGVLLCNPTTARVLRTVADHWAEQRMLAFSPDGRWLATASTQTGGLRIWDPATGQAVWGPPVKLEDRNAWKAAFPAYGPLMDTIEAIAFSPDGHRFATAHLDGGVRIWRWPRDPG